MDDYILISFRASNKKRTEGKKAQRLSAIKSYKRERESSVEKDEVIPYEVNDGEEHIRVFPASIREAYDFGRFMQSWDLSFELHYDAR